MNKKTRMAVLIGLMIVLIGAVAIMYMPGSEEPPAPEDIGGVDETGAPRTVPATPPTDPGVPAPRPDEDPGIKAG